jgi:hypothetical protein
MDLQDALQNQGKPKTPQDRGGDVADDGVARGQLIGAGALDQVCRYRGMQPDAARRLGQILTS